MMLTTSTLQPTSCLMKMSWLRFTQDPWWTQITANAETNLTKILCWRLKS